MIQKMTETSQWTMTMKMKAVVLKMNMKAISSMMTKKREVKVIKDTTKIITNLQKIRKNQKRKKSIAQSLKMSQLGHRIKRVVMRIRLTKIYMINQSWLRNNLRVALKSILLIRSTIFPKASIYLPRSMRICLNTKSQVSNGFTNCSGMEREVSSEMIWVSVRLSRYVHI